VSERRELRGVGRTSTRETESHPLPTPGTWGWLVDEDTGYLRLCFAVHAFALLPPVAAGSLHAVETREPVLASSRPAPVVAAA
jgi:hypothetical protein